MTRENIIGKRKMKEKEKGRKFGDGRLGENLESVSFLLPNLFSLFFRPFFFFLFS